MDWLADVCPLRRRCASAANWHVSGIVLGLRLGPRDSYRYQDLALLASIRVADSRVVDSRTPDPARQI